MSIWNISTYSYDSMYFYTCLPPVITFTPACFQPGYKMQVCCGMYKHSFHQVFWLQCDLTTVPHARLRLKCDSTRAETRFRLSAKRTSPIKSAGASVQSTTGSRGVRISGSNAGFTTFWGSVKSTGYPLHSPVSPSPPHPCVTVCHHISTGLYLPISKGWGICVR